MLSAQGKQAVYLGDVRVARRARGKRAIDFEFIDSADFDDVISSKVREAVALLPLERETVDLPQGHLALDIIVTDFTRGTGDILLNTDLSLIGLFVRPKVVIASRLRDPSSGDIRYRTLTSKRMPLLSYLADSIDLRSAFRLSLRDDETFDRLLLECLLETIVKMQAYLRL